jgi:hypothetical protein
VAAGPKRGLSREGIFKVPEERTQGSEAAGYVYLELQTHFDPEVGRFVAGSPELDVWSSGDTDVQARERASEAVILFLNEATEMGTVWQILRDARVDLHRDPNATYSIWARLHRLATGHPRPIRFSVRPPASRSRLLEARC